jgi:hypothetical protein
MRIRKSAAAFGVLMLIVSIGVLGGAADSGASTESDCAGRPFCIDITDQDGVSRSLTSTHYMLYELTIRRDPTGGRSNLTNGRATLTLTDILGAKDVAPDDPGDPNDLPSNAVFQEDESDSRCSAGSGASSHIVTCTVPNLPAGALPLEYTPLIFTTTTRTVAAPFTVTTEIVAEVRFKEKGSDKQPTDPQVDTATAPNVTMYETDPDRDVSWAFADANLELQTSTADDQWSLFPLDLPSSLTAFEARVQETPVSLTTPCPSTTCHGDFVTTVGGTETFSATNPIEIVATWNFLPSGFTENNAVVYHFKDGEEDPEVITAPCDVDAGEVPAADDLPCRDVEIDHLPRGAVRVEIRAFSDENGGWGFG